MIREFYAVDNH